MKWLMPPKSSSRVRKSIERILIVLPGLLALAALYAAYAPREPTGGLRVTPVGLALTALLLATVNVGHHQRRQSRTIRRQLNHIQASLKKRSR